MEKVFLIAIVMFFADPTRPYWLNDSVEIDSEGGKPLYFKTDQECMSYVDKHIEGLKLFGMSHYSDAVAVKTIYCVEREVPSYK